MADHDFLRRRTLNGSCLLCHHTHAGVNSSLYFHTCSDHRSFHREQRHGLTLHVGSHEGAVRIVILQEWDQSRSHGEYHLRGHVHVVKFIFLILLCLFTVTTGHILVYEMSFLVQRRIRLSHMVVIFFICCHVDNFVRYPRILRIALVDLAVRSLYEAVLVDPRITCKGVDQTDVRTFRRLNGAHSSIMRIMYVTHLESCTVS